MECSVNHHPKLSIDATEYYTHIQQLIVRMSGKLDAVYRSDLGLAPSALHRSILLKTPFD